MFADEVKYFSLKHAWKKTLFNIFVTRVYSWPYFLPEEGYPVFVFRRDMSNSICDPEMWLN